MQLNKTHRAAIIEGLVKCTYKDQFDAMIKRTNELAEQVWDHEHGALERSLRKKLTKGELQKSFSTSPRFRVLRSDPREDSNYYKSAALGLPFIEGPMVHNAKVYSHAIVVGEKPNNYLRSGSQNFLASGKLATITAQARNDINVLPDHPLRGALETLMKDQADLILEASAFMSNLEDVLSSVTTDNKLLELMPEVEPYLPRPKKKQDLVPMSTIEAVRQRINAKS